MLKQTWTQVVGVLSCTAHIFVSVIRQPFYFGLTCRTDRMVLSDGKKSCVKILKNERLLTHLRC